MTTNVQSDARGEVSRYLQGAADIATRLGAPVTGRDLMLLVDYVNLLPAGDSFAAELAAVARGERRVRQGIVLPCPYGCGTALQDTGRDLECPACGCAWKYDALQGARP